jgi:cathepsin B
MLRVSLLSFLLVGTQSVANDFERIAAEVNAANAGWVADAWFASQRFETLSGVQPSLGAWTKGHPKYSELNLPEYNTSSLQPATELPSDFDPKTQWPKCSVIGLVRNQAGCGSCWAFGATESFESSRCIATGADIEFSTDDTAACSMFFGNGCDGGQPSAANQWFVSTGVVTGGMYGSKVGCQPYVCPPCTKGLYPPSCPTDQCAPLLKCEKACGNSAYPKAYSDDKIKASSAFSVRSVSQMQQVLSSNGPLAVAFTVYADFPTYKSGVYAHTSGGVLGGHAVSMQGWGVENGVKYWLVKNSWTDKWGDKGYFKIKRGVDECGIEDDVTGTKHSAILAVV